MANTAKSVKRNNGKDFTGDYLAPVFQQGSGILDAWKAAHSTTLSNVTSPSFNNTANRPQKLTFIITHTESQPTTYQFSHLGADSGHVLSADKPDDHFTEVEALAVFANISISPQLVAVGSGESATVSVSVTKEPDLPEAAFRGSYFGGYIVVDAVEGSAEVSKLQLPYIGCDALLAVMPIMNTTASYSAVLNFPTSTITPADECLSHSCSLGRHRPRQPCSLRSRQGHATPSSNASTQRAYTGHDTQRRKFSEGREYACLVA